MAFFGSGGRSPRHSSPWVNSLAPYAGPPRAASNPGQSARGFAGDRILDLAGLVGWQPAKAGAQGLARLGGFPLRNVIGAGVLGSGLAAAMELSNSQDPAGATGNLVNATGAGVGALAAGAIPIALAGGPVGIGGLALASIAAALGSQAGKGLFRALSDTTGLTTSDPTNKILSDGLKANRAKLAADIEMQKAMLPQYVAAQEAQLALDRQRAEVNQALVSRQNLENSMINMMMNQNQHSNNLIAQATTF